MKKVLLTGINSFTGKHLNEFLTNKGFKVVGTTSKNCDINIIKDLEIVLNHEKPDYIIHLAGISFPAHQNHEELYRVNTIGTINLLEAVINLQIKLEKIILCSSATVYGNLGIEILSEDLCPSPVNHYGSSKLSMEYLSKNYFDKLPIIITRPFNYIGIGQNDNFLIPKMIYHYKNKITSIELGNLNVEREFNDIEFICEAYFRLMISNHASEIVNVASENPIALLSIIDILNEIADYKINIKINSKFIRNNEIKSLCGSSKKLFSLIGEINKTPLNETLLKIFQS